MPNLGRIRISEEMARVLDEQLYDDVGQLFYAGRENPEARRKLRVLLKVRRYLRSLREEMGWDEWDEEASRASGGELQGTERDPEQVGVR